MIPAAVLDACVLYPVGLRDTLLNVAEAGLFRVLWTEEILTETARNIVRDTPGITMEHLEKTFAAMRGAFPEAMISGYEPLIETMTNHPKDRHVLNRRYQPRSPGPLRHAVSTLGAVVVHGFVQ